MASVRFTLLELAGYRPWTELLGSDREWRIQEQQSMIYVEAQRAAARVGALAIPLRYDYLLLLTSNVSEDEITDVVDAIRSVSPVDVRQASGCGKTPMEAVSKAFSGLRGRAQASDSCHDEVAVLAHVDIDDITGLTESTDPVTAFLSVQRLLWRLVELGSPAGAIVQYLGGDNIMVLMPAEGFEGLADNIAGLADVKAGIGVAPRGREASALATRALDEIRANRSLGPVRVLRASQ